MTLNSLKETIRGLNPHDWNQLLMFVVSEERPRREADAIVADTIAELQDSGALEKPDVATLDTPLDSIPLWRDPGTSHALMYKRGDRVKTPAGKVYESIHSGLNHWNPEDPAIPAAVMATQIWRDVSGDYTQPTDSPTPEEDGQPAEYRQPTGASDAYKKGDQVTFQGSVYESLIDSNVWTPTDYPQGWRKL